MLWQTDSGTSARYVAHQAMRSVAQDREPVRRGVAVVRGQHARAVQGGYS